MAAHAVLPLRFRHRAGLGVIVRVVVRDVVQIVILGLSGDFMDGHEDRVAQRHGLDGCQIRVILIRSRATRLTKSSMIRRRP